MSKIILIIIIDFLHDQTYPRMLKSMSVHDMFAHSGRIPKLATKYKYFLMLSV